MHIRKARIEDSAGLARVQVDNSLSLGWKTEDEVMITNFDYEYNGIRSVVVGDEHFCSHCPSASKTPVLVELFKQGVIGDEMHWVHDFDAYQSELITEQELEFGSADIGVTDYGRMLRWNLGSVFFRKSAGDIFGWMNHILYQHGADDEKALWALTGNDTRSIDRKPIKGYTEDDIPGLGNISERVKKMNISYNFLAFNIRSCFGWR